MDGDSGVLIRIGTALGGDGDGFVRRITGDDVAILEYDGGIAEDEIDGAVNVALFVELAFGVNVESVLIPFEAATVED